MRLIILDTETTGSSPSNGDGCIDIGLVEMIRGRLTGRSWQSYVNPQRRVNRYARRVHGLSNAFLADKPRFGEVVGDMLEFIRGAPCLAHGARFDRDMLFHDIWRANVPIPRLIFFDTLSFARAEVQAAKYNLDDLGLELGVASRRRRLHGALGDAALLGRIVQEIERRRPGALARAIRPEKALSPLPKGWKALEAPGGRERLREVEREPTPG